MASSEVVPEVPGEIMFKTAPEVRIEADPNFVKKYKAAQASLLKPTFKVSLILMALRFLMVIGFTGALVMLFMAAWKIA